ncbi:MAG TPA: DHA2 family efflux MFS transporter permease subunit, partial [Albitalea sp.]|nr:DHA2 family efflux MFS transporter permease subunit [Albitalea sp.]
MSATPQDQSLAALRARHGERYRWRVLLTVMIGTMASIMASTIVNVAVPDMSRQFTLGQERAQWLSAGFMAAMTMSMLTTPWLLDRFGYRRTYVGAVCLLMAGGISGGLSRTFDWVLAMRVAEGLAAGVLQPIPAIIILRAFGPTEQGRAMGVFGMGAVLAPALGPSIGGVLVEAFGWRSIFFVVTPFCAAALVLAQRYLPHSAPGGGPVNEHERRLDVIGLGLLTLAVLGTLNGLVQLHGTLPLRALALLGASAAAMAAFVIRQRRLAARGAHPLMELALFTHRPFAMGGTVAFIYGMALFGSTYLVPVFMQIALRLPPSQAGAVLLPAGLVLALTIPVAGRLADRLPVERLVLGGVLLLALSFWLMLTVGLATSLWLITLWAIVGRIGLGFVLPSLNLGAMRGLPPTLISQGSSTVNFLRQLGGAVGVNLVGIVLEWRLRSHAGA